VATAFRGSRTVLPDRPPKRHPFRGVYSIGRRGDKGLLTGLSERGCQPFRQHTQPKAKLTSVRSPFAHQGEELAHPGEDLALVGEHLAQVGGQFALVGERLAQFTSSFALVGELHIQVGESRFEVGPERFYPVSSPRRPGEPWMPPGGP